MKFFLKKPLVVHIHCAALFCFEDGQIFLTFPRHTKDEHIWLMPLRPLDSGQVHVVPDLPRGVRHTGATVGGAVKHGQRGVPAGLAVARQWKGRGAVHVHCVGRLENGRLW